MTFIFTVLYSKAQTTEGLIFRYGLWM